MVFVLVTEAAERCLTRGMSWVGTSSPAHAADCVPLCVCVLRERAAHLSAFPVLTQGNSVVINTLSLSVCVTHTHINDLVLQSGHGHSNVFSSAL